MKSPSTRRTFLGLVLTGSAGAAFGSRAQASTAGRTSREAALLVALTGIFRNRESAARIGERYLRETPHEARTDVLAARIVEPGAAATRVDAASVQGHAKARVQADFEAGEMVVVDGWMLARTEARLCGLVYLSTARA